MPALADKTDAANAKGGRGGVASYGNLQPPRPPTGTMLPPTHFALNTEHA